MSETKSTAVKTKNKSSKGRSKTTPSKQRLTIEQQLFVDELLADEDMVGWKAYQRAFKCINRRSCEQSASRLLSLVKIQDAIAIGMQNRKLRLRIDQDTIVRRLVTMVRADPNDIVEYRRENCRHCHGIGHHFQWKDESEFKAAREAAEKEAKAAETVPVLPHDRGGYGYDQFALPVATCPNCGGVGHGHMHVHDTRFLPDGARLLYAGMEQTKEGIKPKLHDQLAVMDKLMRHLGMFNDKLMVQGDKENPLDVLLKQLPGNIIKPVGDD